MTRGSIAAGAAAIVLASVVLASAGVAHDAGGEPSRYDEPVLHPVRDGSYLGYVRLVEGVPGTVAVDFVSLRRGEPVNEDTTEVHLEAGGLATSVLLGRAPAPFRLVIHTGDVVALESIDLDLR